MPRLFATNRSFDGDRFPSPGSKAKPDIRLFTEREIRDRLAELERERGIGQ